jgi:hypothetical protein
MLGVLGVSVFGFLCIFNKLRLAVAIIKTAALFIKDEFLIILVPPVSAIFVFALWIWWIFTAMYFAINNLDMFMLWEPSKEMDKHHLQQSHYQSKCSSLCGTLCLEDFGLMP